jgi:hypothetical protein
MMTAILLKVATAIPGITTSQEVVSIEELNPEDFPFAMIIQTDMAAERADWDQIEEEWTFTGVVVQEAGTREDMHTKLEAIQVNLRADRTLNFTVHDAIMSTSVPYSHPDARHLYGTFTVTAKKTL